MQEIFIALIFLFDASTGQPLEAGVIAFEEEEVCQFYVDRVRERAVSDMLVSVDANCVSTPIVRAD